ncbi:hypothetical protein PJ311_19065 [Bacillus sp. CLL-7-23]|uniref:Helix-turn-helix domain containing protein n=1 Tax=Bacillus changyiensis TaxID=3004103 RepID=A0ABT4X8N7_9BACI|nr:hypothetical protein [Bacillus changyiensis]MDA7028636.1 hypothetical protein [Bacillus changyiensis]
MGVYIMLDHCNFDWQPEEVKQVESYWQGGLPIERIAKIVKRPVKEVFLLLYDRAELGHIRGREGGIFGA